MVHPTEPTTTVPAGAEPQHGRPALPPPSGSASPAADAVHAAPPAVPQSASAGGGPRRPLPPKVIIKTHSMPDDMQSVAVELAVNALSKFELERDMARYLKMQFDLRFQPTWHCIIGRHFGSYVTYEHNAFIYFYIDNLAILLFRSGNLMP